MMLLQQNICDISQFISTLNLDFMKYFFVMHKVIQGKIINMNCCHFEHPME